VPKNPSEPIDWNRVLFTCAICERDILECHSHDGRYQQMAPVCTRCEHEFGSAEPVAGAFKDRRRACQVHALAEALFTIAAHREQGYATTRL